MLAFLAWYLAVSLLGLLTFPLVWRLFPALADRGYSLSRAFGLLSWSFIFWLLASLGVIHNDAGGLILALSVVVTLSLGIFWGARREGGSSFLGWFKNNRRLVITMEVLFLLAFAGWSFVRACNPELTSAGGEKTMEVAFINAILRSETFPPHDPWLSGYAISYYYFGYVMTAMLAQTTAVAGSVAHNLMLALTFALSAVAAYGVVFNLLAEQRLAERKPSLGLPLLAPFFLLIVSNIEGFLELLHAHGLFRGGEAGKYNFWTWLNIQELGAASLADGWPPRFYWWWRASRVIQDIDLAGNAHEIIDEFPFFSYLLGDLHPHVLSMPFVLLGVAMAWNIFRGGWDGERRLFGVQFPLQLRGLFCSAWVLGGLAFLNTWDILPLTALVLAAFLFRRIQRQGWGWVRIEEALVLAIPLAVLSLLLYLPFYFGFASQAGGILPNLVAVTRGIHLWVMFAPLFVPLFAWLIHQARRGTVRPRLMLGFGIAGIFSLLLWCISWLLGLIVWAVYPELGASYLVSQGVGSTGELFINVFSSRAAQIGGWLTLFALLGLALAMLFSRSRPAEADEFAIDRLTPMGFVLLLVLIGGVLVLAPEFVYLRDNFGWRMNTIFKFYYQSWEFWALAAAFGTAVLLQQLRRAKAWIFRSAIALVLAMACVYPVLALWDKTGGFRIEQFRDTLAAYHQSGDPAPLRRAAQVWTLDGAVLFAREYPQDAVAVAWLQNAPVGVLVEAVENYAASYTDFGHISVYSGMPAVLGWGGHQSQWRGTYEGLAERANDIQRLYESHSWEETQAVLDKYDVRYVYIGTLERRNYRIDEEKFRQYLVPVYQGGEVVIYLVP